MRTLRIGGVGGGQAHHKQRIAFSVPGFSSNGCLLGLLRWKHRGARWRAANPLPSRIPAHARADRHPMKRQPMSESPIPRRPSLRF